MANQSIPIFCAFNSGNICNFLLTWGPFFHWIYFVIQKSFFLFNIYISPFTLGQQFVIHVLFTGEPICLFIWFLFSNNFQVFRRSSPQWSGVKFNQIYELIHLYTRWIYLYQRLASWGHQLDHVKLWNKL